MQLLAGTDIRPTTNTLDILDEGHSPLPDMTIQEMYLVSSIIVQMGHHQRDKLKDYWSTLEQFFTAFY
jgi:hypothetical protein